MDDRDSNLTLDDLTRPEPFATRYSDAVGSLTRLRYLLRHRHHNGLTDSGAVVERGRSLYIVKPRFLDWILNSKQGASR
jgi:hypothetical protein